VTSLSITAAHSAFTLNQCFRDSGGRPVLLTPRPYARRGLLRPAALLLRPAALLLVWPTGPLAHGGLRLRVLVRSEEVCQLLALELLGKRVDLIGVKGVVIRLAGPGAGRAIGASVDVSRLTARERRQGT
jgi:hypothetical protein